jgi:glucose/arabinose dehydrogenase
VFTRGHRQPWLINWDAKTGLLLLAENGGDELDDHEEINRTRARRQLWAGPSVFADGLSTRRRAPTTSTASPPRGSCTSATPAGPAPEH